MIQYKEANNDSCVNCSELKDSRANLDLIKRQIPEASIGGQERERELKMSNDYLINFCTIRHKNELFI